MADTKPTNKITLPPEMAKRLESMDADIAEAKRGSEVMKRLGIDTKDMDEKIAWADEVRRTLLKEFT